MSCIYNFSMNSKRDSATTQTAKKIATQCVGARVRMLNRLVTRIYDDSLREHGIKFSQMNILTLIALRHSIQPSEVGRVLALEKSTLSRNFRLMEENGWIEAIPGETGNSLLLQLTPIGQRLYKKAGKPGSLRSFARSVESDTAKELVANWFHNKTANFSKPPLGIGNTRKKKNRN